MQLLEAVFSPLTFLVLAFLVAVVMAMAADSVRDVMPAPSITDGCGRRVLGCMISVLGTGLISALILIAFLLATRSSPTTALQVGQEVKVGLSFVTLRRTPGDDNKPASDVITLLAEGQTVYVSGGPQEVNKRTWWKVRVGDYEGWLPQTDARGTPVLQPR